MVDTKSSKELLQRLRVREEHEDHAYLRELFGEAADEIERLRDHLLIAINERDKYAQQRADWKAVADSRLGHEPAADKTCSQCYGSGTIEVADEAGPNAHPMDINCPACRGTGSTSPPGMIQSCGLKLDRLGWVCSVCFGWNEKGTPMCEHPHALTKVSAT